MAKESSVAPKERINIVYKPATGDAKEEIELPLKLLILGDFTLREDETALEDRKVVSIDKNNFDEVLRGQKLNVSITAENKLAEEGGEIPVNLKFNALKDFEPQGVAQQVPELQKLLELREALTTLKGPLGNVPSFRKRIQSLITDEATREKLLQELQAKEGGAEAAEEGKEEPGE